MVRRAIIWVLRAYQGHISPLSPARCRFQPTCSEYAIQAVKRYGVIRGGYLAIRRVLRCHPLGPQGQDPVP